MMIRLTRTTIVALIIIIPLFALALYLVSAIVCCFACIFVRVLWTVITNYRGTTRGLFGLIRLVFELSCSGFRWLCLSWD